MLFDDGTYLANFEKAIRNLIGNDNIVFSKWHQSVLKVLNLGISNLQSTIPDYVIVHGEVEIGPNCKFIGPAVICGPSIIGSNVIFGPFSYVRPGSIIEDYSEIGHSVEIKNSHVGKNARLRHKCYIGDSFFWERVLILELAIVPLLEI